MTQILPFSLLLQWMRPWYLSHPGVNFPLINEWVKDGNSELYYDNCYSCNLRLTRGRLNKPNKIRVLYWGYLNCSLRYSRFTNILLLHTKYQKALNVLKYKYKSLKTDPVRVRVKGHNLEAFFFGRMTKQPSSFNHNKLLNNAVHHRHLVKPNMSRMLRWNYKARYA
jgi:hypothetical protein